MYMTMSWQKSLNNYLYRENLLMYYFLDMSDTEFEKLQNISRSGVFQNRHYALKQMKKSLEEEN